ncbi:MAG: hypothetical protein J7M08_02685 [Planctomycetes bacterium]|nr:hypothetical protein [Planctomycetota bacterium]
MDMKYPPLSKEEVRASVLGRGGARPPALLHKWAGEGLREAYGEALDEVLDRYPDDVPRGLVLQPGDWRMPEDFPDDYRWDFRDAGEEGPDSHGLDSGDDIIRTWADLEPFLDHLHKLGEMVSDGLPIFEPVREAVRASEGRYVIAEKCHYFYERLWMLRGMQNIMLDFHDHPDEVHRLCDGLLQFALLVVEGCAQCGADGYLTTNDLGHQTGLMMSPDTFRQFLKPRLSALAEACHAHGMDFWLHSCGNLTEILPDLMEIGVTCLHPLQHGAMDWERTAQTLDGRITAWPGADVQQVLPYGTPAEVREHVRHLIDTFYRPGEGRLVVAAGNGITLPTTLENIDAFLDETFRYGLEVSA